MPDIASADSDSLIVPPLPARMRFVAIVSTTALYCGMWLIGPLAIVGDLISAQLRISFWASGIVCLLISVGLGTYARAVQGTALVVAAPVRGRWMALHSPASKVPSHGTHGFGQAYAVDLIYSPTDQPGAVDRRRTAAFCPPEDFPSYGQPLFAVADGTVVRVYDRQPDHKSRSTPAALFYFAIEGVVRLLGPPAWVLGNHLVIRLQDGSHMLYAHLRRGSLQVSLGDHVRPGNVIASCGNSGYTTEPHVHIQRQDVASVLTATGMPWAIAWDEKQTPGFPKTAEIVYFD